MTLQDFINKYNNKKLEKVDSNAYAQCMDLIVAWIEEGLGYPRLTNGIYYAYQMFMAPTQGLKDNFNFIANTPTGIPSPGDIIVWSNKYGPAGHVAVVVEADINTFKAFSQNDPTGSVCVVKTYNYNNVLGWLENKKLEPLKECLRLHGETVKSLTELQENYKREKINWTTTEQRLKEEKDIAVKEKDQKLIEKDNIIQNINQLVNEKNNIISKLQSTISTLEQQLLDCESRLVSLEEQSKKVPVLQEQLDHLEQSKRTWTTLEKKYKNQITKLEESSYTTADTQSLFAELVKRGFKKLSVSQ